MAKLVFILGGARSGKSSYAVHLAGSTPGKKAFIATAIPFDGEMKERIKKHKLSRPKSWRTIEEPKDVDKAFTRSAGKFNVAIIDCVGIWVSNLIMDDSDDKSIMRRIESLIAAAAKVKKTVIVVSNDVGAGLVPETALGRRFRDLLGLANQMLAAAADEVIFMQAGIPLKIK